ncbi:MAG: polymer-forming cytoskeletal protein [Candidatus Omnitrophica bacterium]|nr:polymer-forming cytoskeletal protein [Candidatus Omnitrophota bacterium]
MLGMNRRRSSRQGQDVLDVTASMQGTLVFKEPVSLRISGPFKGTLETRGDLTVGEKAQVEADITGESITIAGRVTGKIAAKKSLRVAAPAMIRGEITTPRLVVEEGARIEGTIRMSSEADRMTLGEVAEYLEVEQGVLSNWVRDGKIPATKQGDEWRFDKSQIDEWVASQKSS